MYAEPDDPFPGACSSLVHLIESEQIHDAELNEAMERLCSMPAAMRRVNPGSASYLSADLAIVKELLKKHVQSTDSAWETHPLGKAFVGLEAVAYLNPGL